MKKNYLTTIFLPIVNFAWYLQHILLFSFIIIILLWSVGIINSPIFTTKIAITLNPQLESVKGIMSNNQQYMNAKIEYKNTVLSYQSKPSFMMMILPSGFAFFTSLYITFILKSILQSIQNNNLFNKQTTNRLRNVGICICIIPVFLFLIQIILNNHITSNFLVTDYVIVNKFNFEFQYLLLGLVIILLSEIFRVGLHLQEENNSTI